MRRWLTRVVLGGVAALTLAGCGAPAGVDRDLTDDWAVPGEPAPFTPETGACHPEFHEVGYITVYRPVDCADEHMVETIHVGTFTGEHADRATLPPAGSPARLAAWRECDAKAAETLGADWRTGRLWLSVVLPSPQGWLSGARWFRCDLAEVESPRGVTLVRRSGSLAGALKDGSPLSLGCFNVQIKGDLISKLVPVACDKPHNSEFVGVYTAPDTPYDVFEENDKQLHNGCLEVTARYAGLPNDRLMRYRTGTIASWPSEQEWDAGNRGVRCFLLVNRKLTRSAKGAGTAVLPLR